jgi:Domain of unknown function (DUF4440)
LAVYEAYIVSQNYEIEKSQSQSQGEEGRMKRFVTSAIVLTVVWSGPAALLSRPVDTAKQTDRQAILKAEQALQEALGRADKGALDKILAENFEWTDSQGKIWTKAEVLGNPAPLKAECEGDPYFTQVLQHYYDGGGGAVGVLYRLQHEPRYSHIYVKHPEGWRAFIFFDTPNPPPGKPRPKPRAEADDPQGTTNCQNPCKTLPYTPKTEAEKEVILSWQRQKVTENIPDSQAAINAWEVRVSDDGLIIVPGAPTEYTAGRLADLVHMWENGVRSPGGPYVVSMHMYTIGKDVVIFTAHQHPSSGIPKPANYAVRIWVKKYPPFDGILNPNPLPWESRYIWQICLSQHSVPMPE